MARGRHRAPVDHHVRRAVVAGTAATGLATGGLLAVTDFPTLEHGANHLAPSFDPTVTIRVVPAAAERYVVAPGDTLSLIAPRVGEDWHKLYADNTSVIGANPNLIFPGEALALETVNPAPPPPVPTPVAASAPRHAAPVAGSQVVADAEHYLGVPYVWGGTTPAGFDCSGLVQHVLGDLGIAVPRTAYAQSTVGAPVASLADAQPGDLLFFYTPVSHVAIYLGHGQMIAAPQTGENVQIQTVWASPTVIRRLV